MSDNGRKTGPRCIAIVGPFASGKTSLLEAILARTGAIEKPGAVANGTHGRRFLAGGARPFDERRAERRRNRSSWTRATPSSIAPARWSSTTRASRSSPAIDAAIVVAEPDEKKIPALQVVLRHLEERGIPRFLFLNKIDKASMGVRDALALLQPASETPLVLRQIPIWKDEIATGFIDLALDRAFVYREHAQSEVIELDDGEQSRRDEARFTMLERLADHDDALMEQLLEDIQPPRDKVFADLAAELRAGQIVPVLIGSALNGNGILRLLKALRHEAPNVEDTRKRLGVADATKTAAAGDEDDPHQPCRKALAGARARRPGRRRHGASDRRAATSERSPASSGWSGRNRPSAARPRPARRSASARSSRRAPATRSARRARKVAPLAVPAAPQAVLRQVVNPTERKDEVKLSSALARMVEEDPSLSVDHRQDTGETLLGGQGEMHLRVAVERLTSRFGLKLETKRALVPYRETIRATVSKRGRHKKQSGGHGQFGDVVLEVKPLPRGSGFVFDDTITGGVVPKNYIPAVEAGVREALKNGPLGGFPVVDIGVTLTDGSYHDVDSSDQAFKMAGILGMREALPEARPVLLEPVLRVKIAVPNDNTARVNAIVSGRRGQLMGYDARPGWNGWDVVEALIPEAEIADLIIELRSATAGVGTFTAEFDKMAEVTGRLADDILAQAKKQAA